jgi:hypothetical protein
VVWSDFARRPALLAGPLSNNVGCQLIFDRRDLIFYPELLFLEPPYQ